MRLRHCFAVCADSTFFSISSLPETSSNGNPVRSSRMATESIERCSSCRAMIVFYLSEKHSRSKRATQEQQHKHDKMITSFSRRWFSCVYQIFCFMGTSTRCVLLLMIAACIHLLVEALEKGKIRMIIIITRGCRLTSHPRINHDDFRSLFDNRSSRVSSLECVPERTPSREWRGRRRRFLVTHTHVLPRVQRHFHR